MATKKGKKVPRTTPSRQRIKERTKRDLPAHIWPDSPKTGKPKQRPKPSPSSRSSDPKGEPTPKSSWIKKVKHINGMVAIMTKTPKSDGGKGTVWYYFNDRRGTLYNALLKAQQNEGGSLGKTYWRKLMRNLAFIKRKA